MTRAVEVVDDSVTLTAEAVLVVLRPGSRVGRWMVVVVAEQEDVKFPLLAVPLLWFGAGDFETELQWL